MRLILTGATGFSGGEVLRQALADASVEAVLVLTRRPTGLVHAKLTEVVRDDFLDYSDVDLRGYDACIWCLGVSQLAVDEAQYERITCGYTIAAATAMLAASPRLRFCFVSGASADRTEAARSRYARSKGRAERQLATLSTNAFHFRPGYIRATKRSVPRKDAGRFYVPVAALLELFSDKWTVDCDALARALLHVAASGAAGPVLDNRAIRQLAAAVQAERAAIRSGA